MTPNFQQQYFDANGRPTIAGMELLEDMARRLQSAEDKLSAIADVTAPTGGGTTDAEARTAINAILAAAT